MVHQQRHPRYTHTFIDSCAFDPGGIEESASRRILEKWPNVIVAHSVQKEMGKSLVYTIEKELTPELLKKRAEIRTLIQGNAMSGKHKGDADHLFELYKYGGGYFVTTDVRLLSHSDTLFRNYFIMTIKPTEYEELL
jgi:hypothetical protein